MRQESETQKKSETGKKSKTSKKSANFALSIPDDKRHGDGHGGGGGGGESYVSSLFNHNPDIPRLDLTNAEPQKEDVFSLRTFSDTGVHPYISKVCVDQL